MAEIGIIGAGSWGSALAFLLGNNGHHVTVWSIDQEEVKMLQSTRQQQVKLPDVILPDSVEVTGSIEKALSNRDLIVMAVPSPYVRSTARLMKPYIRYGQLIVSVGKGIEADTLMTLTEQIADELPGTTTAVLSGPSHAEEVGKAMPTAVVTGAKTRETAEYVQNIFMSEVFRVYTSPDVRGIELAGSIKNVIALAAGMADGLGCGDNTKAALITRGLKEITELGTSMGGMQETFQGLAGMGDLIVTCASRHSRNRKAGCLIGQGYTMKAAMDEVRMIVEGVYSAEAAWKLADIHHIEMPIVEQVHRVLFEDKPASEALRDLMIRDKKIEHSDLPWD